MIPAGMRCEIDAGTELRVNSERNDKSVESSKNLRQIAPILQK